MLHLEHKPQVHSSVFVSRSSDIIGAVEIGEDSSVWFQVVLRADVMPIKIGSRTNIQDGTVIHGSLGKAQTTVGNGVTIGHKVMLHGCTIEDDVLVGMGACVMDNAMIKKNCIVAAGSLVTEKSAFEEGSLILGSPARVVRKLKDEELRWIKNNAAHYIKYAKSYMNSKNTKDSGNVNYFKV